MITVPRHSKCDHPSFFGFKMSSSPLYPRIDEDLKRNFSRDKLRQIFFDYKDRKTDFFDPDQISIAMGADGVDYESFENDLNKNVASISKKILEGKYLFYPFREVEVDKPGGKGKRVLSIASIRDVIVQQQLYQTLCPVLDKLFSQRSVDHVSFAYRSGKSAPKAALQVYKYLKEGYIHAIDADIVKYFDTIPHKDLLNILKLYIDEKSITYKLTKRFIRTDRVPYSTYQNKKFIYDDDKKKRHCLHGKDIFKKIKPTREPRLKGVPQGGVMSGMLANLYLHNFDRWIMEKITRRFDLRYVRYADDFIILFRSPDDLELVRDKVASKLDTMGLELHKRPDKTRLVNAADEGLNFVGFHLTPADISIRKRNIDRFKKRFIEKLYSDSSWTLDCTLGKRFCLLINQKLNFKILGRPIDECPDCGLPSDLKPKSWIGFFSIVTDVGQLRRLDKWIRAEITRYFIKQYKCRLSRKLFRKANLASIEQEYYRIRKLLRKGETCKCVSE